MNKYLFLVFLLIPFSAMAQTEAVDSFLIQWRAERKMKDSIKHVTDSIKQVAAKARHDELVRFTRERRIADSVAALQEQAAAELARKNEAKQAAVKRARRKKVASAGQGISLLKYTSRDDGNGDCFVFAKVANRSGKMAQYVALTVVYYNQLGDIVGTGLGNAVNIPANGERTITCLARKIFGAKRLEVEVSNAVYK